MMGKKTIQEQLISGLEKIVGKSSGHKVYEPGVWQITEPIVVGMGETLEIGAETTLKFAPESGIFIDGGTLRVSGDISTTVFESMADQPWKGISIARAAKDSYFKGATIRNACFKGPASRVYYPRWFGYGLFVYSTPDFKIGAVSIENSPGTALAISHSTVDIKDVGIAKSGSDGFHCFKSWLEMETVKVEGSEGSGLRFIDSEVIGSGISSERNKGVGMEFHDGNAEFNGLLASYNNGGGIYAHGFFFNERQVDSCLLEIKSGEIARNRADVGAGLNIHMVNYCVLEDVTVHHNQASNFGGGIYMSDSYVVLRGTRIEHNKAPEYNNVYCEGGEPIIE